jgi:formyltetrahydrofolate hydrolase
VQKPTIKAIVKLNLILIYIILWVLARICMDKKVKTLIKNHKTLGNLVRILRIDQKIIITLKIKIETLERAIKKITKMEKQDLVLIKIRQVQTSSQVSHKQDKIRLLKVF